MFVLSDALWYGVVGKPGTFAYGMLISSLSTELILALQKVSPTMLADPTAVLQAYVTDLRSARGWD